MSSGDYGYSPRDSTYASLNAKYDIRRHRRHLTLLMKRKHPNIHLNRIGISVDYFRGFPTFDTFLLQDLKQDAANDPHLSAIVDMVERNSDAGKHMSIVSVTYPYAIGKKYGGISFVDVGEDGEPSWQAPRLRAGTVIKESDKRASGRFKGGDIPLEASFDEVDEIARRMALCSDSMREPLVLLDQVLARLEEDWPFDSPFTFYHSFSQSRIS